MRRPAALILALLVAAAPAAAQDAALEAEVTWRDDADGFGSFSGLLVSPRGDRILTVSDKGHIAEARLRRDAGGRLTGVALTRIAPILDPQGAPVTRFAVDGEGLARAPTGGVFVSFEATHRVDAYADPFGPAEPLPMAPAFRELQNNSGLEAIFTDATGRLHALPERSGALERPFPVWRLAEEGWTEAFTIPRRPPHLPVGADVGPDGRLYLLERHFAGLRGFQTRGAQLPAGSGGRHRRARAPGQPAGALRQSGGHRRAHRRRRARAVADDLGRQRLDLPAHAAGGGQPRREAAAAAAAASRGVQFRMISHASAAVST